MLKLTLLQNEKEIGFMFQNLRKLLESNSDSAYIFRTPKAPVAQWIKQWIPKPKHAPA